MVDAILASSVPVFLVMALGAVAGLTKDIDNRFRIGPRGKTRGSRHV